MARPELPGAAVPHSAACSSISVGGSRPLFQPPAKNALLFFVLLWYIGLGIVKAALKSSIFLFFLGQLCYFNLSPQGDENFLASSMPARYQYFNLSPQGDENILTALMDLIAFSFQLIPARGRKQSKTCNLTDHIDFNLSPQGDGNDITNVAPADLFYFNLSPQGDGN